MINSRTVFVLGAGASMEAGLKDGAALSRIISSKLRTTGEDAYGRRSISDGDIRKALLQIAGQRGEDYLRAADAIQRGVTLSHSIDDYLTSFVDRPEISTVAKLAIAKSILEMERGSSLHVNNSNVQNTINFLSLEDVWYPVLFQLLTSRVSVNSPERMFENVTFVSFNYDRCIEHFLLHAVKSRFHTSWQEAKLLCDHATIVHPYGSLGVIPRPDESGGMPYGTTDSFDLVEMSKNIKTFDEQIDDSAFALVQTRKAIAEADTIIFLGFAFHAQNLEFLIPKGQFDPRRVIATTLLPAPTVDVVKNQFVAAWGGDAAARGKFDGRVTFVPKKCFEVLRDYSRQITG